MLTTNLTIGSETYNLTGNDLTKSVRARTGDSDGIDQTLTISHSKATIAGVSNDRHLVRVDHFSADEAGKLSTASAYLVINRPLTSAISQATIVAMVVALTTLMTASSNADLVKILNNEI